MKVKYLHTKCIDFAYCHVKQTDKFYKKIKTFLPFKPVLKFVSLLEGAI